MPRIEVLFDDEHLLAVNKPPYITSVPDGTDNEPSLQHQLEKQFGKLWAVHRLDRDTSGVIVFARDAETHANLSAQFENRAAKKIYHALVRGKPAWNEIDVNTPLTVDADRKHRTRADSSRGKPAHTHLKVIEAIKDFCLIEASPTTGRTHQIRVHLAGIGFPIVCDPLYGEDEPLMLSALKRNYRVPKDFEFEERPLIARTALHAIQLALIYPESVMLNLDSAYAKDFSAAINQLKKL
jgi:RluA family pseudouridine synthase